MKILRRLRKFQDSKGFLQWIPSQNPSGLGAQLFEMRVIAKELSVIYAFASPQICAFNPNSFIAAALAYMPYTALALSGV